MVKKKALLKAGMSINKKVEVTVLKRGVDSIRKLIRRIWRHMRRPSRRADLMGLR